MFNLLAVGRQVCRRLVFCACLSPFYSWAGDSDAAVVLSAVEGLPAEFEAHFFDVPLAVRVELDGRYLGDAMVILTRDNRVQLLEFTDTQDSHEPAHLRSLWQGYLAPGRALGDCRHDCPGGLKTMHYSLANSQLSLLTRNAEKTAQASRYHRVPEQGSAGLLLRNQLNVVNDGNSTSGRINLMGQGSLGSWTGLADAQVDRSDGRQGRDAHRVAQLYAERLQDEHFWRLGYVMPEAQGLVRQPTMLGNAPRTTLGVMFGSSDSLLVDNGQASAVPIHVTPNRPGLVEIYRNGSLINSQQVQPGLQTLDTRVLPGGIYEVQVRLIEDGRETSRSEAFIYKPAQWQNLDSRWRYNLYLGRQASVLDNRDEPQADGLAAGVMSNYLLHPSAVLGLSAQQVEGTRQYGTSLDWDASEQLRLYGNLNHTDGRGSGYDLQVTHTYARGSLLLSHHQLWLESRPYARGEASRLETSSQSSVSLNHRVTSRSSATLRLEHAAGASGGLGVDLGWVFHGKLLGSDSNFRLSLFDRPEAGRYRGRRSRGVNLSVSMSLALADRQAGIDVGSRAGRDGEGTDRHASLWYQQDVELGPVHSLGGGAMVDRYGTGFSANGRLQGQAFDGDLYAQTSTYDNKASGGLNLQSTLAMGGGQLTLSGQGMVEQAGLIIDVDTDLEGVALVASDEHGSSSELHAGRNVIPVSAFKEGHVTFDFDARQAPAAQIQPTSMDYHLNRGGVEYRQLKVLRTVTVLGRLVDGHGQAIRGARVINDAGRSVSEADGYFTVEMNESRPTLEVQLAGALACLLNLSPEQHVREDDVLMVGDQRCMPPQAGRAEDARFESIDERG
ncbi:TcfC E-set like domain-containing protein [Pseudomonas putida]|uniref:TcfC E-set like domain-containing protein n=1 Tax=Pseudomonas putida TaxID=303 RepID=UPI0012997C9B|nr:TcfC E-set like domain-containing protein [Pseudomonas putida]MRF43374.1 pilus assembly protein PapC [Escherichia coli]HDS0977007.1 CS1-pili formation C-terminal domain-containing protein [Pseudomonas putida]